MEIIGRFVPFYLLCYKSLTIWSLCFSGSPFPMISKMKDCRNIFKNTRCDIDEDDYKKTNGEKSKKELVEIWVDSCACTGWPKQNARISLLHKLAEFFLLLGQLWRFCDRASDVTCVTSLPNCFFLLVWGYCDTCVTMSSVLFVTVCKMWQFCLNCQKTINIFKSPCTQARHVDCMIFLQIHSLIVRMLSYNQLICVI